MTKPKTTPKQREADLAAVRKAGGDTMQSHWMARLRAVMRKRAKAASKAKAAQ